MRGNAYEMVKRGRLSMEMVQISEYKLECLIDAAADNCITCPAFDICEKYLDLKCYEKIRKWLEEE